MDVYLKVFQSVGSVAQHLGRKLLLALLAPDVGALGGQNALSFGQHIARGSNHVGVVRGRQKAPRAVVKHYLVHRQSHRLALGHMALYGVNLRVDVLDELPSCYLLLLIIVPFVPIVGIEVLCRVVEPHNGIDDRLAV